MDSALNIQLSTTGAYYPEETLLALKETCLHPGRCVSDAPRGATWVFSRLHIATLSTDTGPVYFKIAGVVRETVLTGPFPHITILPLFEQDATTFYNQSDPKIDWELLPDGLRPNVVLKLKSGRDMPIHDTTATFRSVPNPFQTLPTLPPVILKRNDIIIAHTTAHLEATFVAPATYSYTVHHIALAYSATDNEAGL
ncbi:hypothetical protein PYCCODRAFT_1419602 [Trametes coccinea BRFM310]|uniref:Uncharacterized protein n=1 Tax=Trametes coccinea (strain BRFM310) TaxID=1353009 RepID=A0A1Y2I8C1_TRAC3|nr:hypothetical protein PYCCODRAFT_1419602 [Trametes coccinea BRFM310]